MVSPLAMQWKRGWGVRIRMRMPQPATGRCGRCWQVGTIPARVLELRDGATTRKVELPAADQFTGAGAPLESSEIRPGIGYIRFNDSLGDDATVAAFDRALHELRQTRGLVIDLRNTASGGNTSVARGILGRFVQQEQPYQKHVLPSEERETGVRRSWLELVSPRGEFTYSQPVVVLVNRWTGSMGEGLAIGFDARAWALLSARRWRAWWVQRRMSCSRTPALASMFQPSACTMSMESRASSLRRPCRSTSRRHLRTGILLWKPPSRSWRSMTPADSRVTIHMAATRYCRS